MLNTIAVLVPYFGALPSMFPLWVLSCKMNPNIDWLVFTDDQVACKVPNNVRIVSTTFDAMRERIQACFPFHIKLDSPWGLCAFRPAYGEIFKQELEGYNFWGYCDLDVVFGDLSKFITGEILNAYDKILPLGHLALYRNQPSVTQAYRLRTEAGEVLYQKAFSMGTVACFDEIGINDIFKANGLHLYSKTIFADFVHRSYLFSLLYFNNDLKHGTKRHIFSWQDGVLTRHYLVEGDVYTEEFAYIHFCRRLMRVDVDVSKTEQRFCIIPNRFVRFPNKLDGNYILRNTKNRFYWSYWKPRITPKHLYRRMVGCVKELA
ncbi:MAG: hypothetical protein PHR35_00195 [Kiritimatiellae bacterium]|nr:hypothetical protein [Kiritimatiellia bacterium]